LKLQIDIYQEGGIVNVPIVDILKSKYNVLEFLEKINNIKIQHALNEGEFTILNTKYKSDGYCKENNTIYEFHGDYWHGNSKIFNPNDLNTIFGKTYSELYKNTLKREQ
jgi:hypothetical protein